MKKRIIFLIIFSLMIVGCGKEEYIPKNVKIHTIDEYKDNSVNSLDEIITKNNYIIVDVRTKEEYDSGHIKGAINIPYDTIDDKTNLDKTKTVLVYCKSGNRSSKAYQILKNLKYDVYDLGAYDSIKLDKE